MIFFTGSTGFLGRELIGRLLVSRPDQEFALLVRSSKREPAVKRVETILQSAMRSADTRQWKGRIRIIEGDLSRNRFGLSESQFADLARETREIFHCAASTSLAQTLHAAWKTNVAGTDHVIDLAKNAAELQGSRIAFHHISTAYVAGDTKDTVQPSYLYLKGLFRNGYEESKARAEEHVLAAREYLKLKIYRPSMIVGDSVTGETSAFNVIYIPARLLVQGLLNVVPGIPHTPFDVVPVDYVADGITKLSARDGNPEEFFHLCSGVGRETTPKEILNLAVQALQNYRKHGAGSVVIPPFVPLDVPQIMDLASMAFEETKKNIGKFVRGDFQLIRRLRCMVPYMTSNPRFAVDGTQVALGNLSPQFSNYGERIFSYCLDTNWGRSQWTNPQGYLNWRERLVHK
ncbi:SDR family oxidoreductase [bacterium]|nr:SDR family oxidoreductase [bacterium]